MSADYQLRAPFMTRAGQFEAGKQTLAVGISEKVLLASKPDRMFTMTIGRSGTVYKQTAAKLLAAKHTIWTNPRGSRVRITPVSEFEADRGQPLEPHTAKLI